MAVTIKMQARGVVTLPKKIRTRLNLKTGSILKIDDEGGRVVLSHLQPPTEREEVMDDLRRALEDLRAGRVSPAFNSGEEFEAHMKSKRVRRKR